jgi:hypothetical protein
LQMGDIHCSTVSIAACDAAILHAYPFGAEAALLLTFRPWNQATVGGDHPPPGEAGGAAQDVSHCPGSSREAGLGCDLPVSHHLSRLKSLENRQDRKLEGGHVVAGCW